ncbi:hypothetical protein CTI12_AA406200 [Artemisia annua]|uniref:Replication factor A C-terminal domain-containing protein n=1 Tax=Artemisia annua TaxID=35608 RepID=A0A2U1M959_ARTAN|nr:hypothetical protein CTI12_AA406200 [Artemisia annua]
MPKRKQSSNIEPLLRGSAPKKPLHAVDMHSLQVNFDRPFGDVSGSERQWSIQEEVPSVSRCHERTLYADNDAMLVECHTCGSSRGVVNSHNCDTGFGKGKAICSEGNATGNPTHAFRMYENTLFQPEWSIPCNSHPPCLGYTEIGHAYSLGPANTAPFSVYQTYGNMLFESRVSHLPNIQKACLPQQPEARLHPLTSKGRPCKRKPGIPLQGIMFKGKRRRGSGTDKQQQNVVDGKRNSHYTDQMHYLSSGEPSVDLHSPASTHVSSAAERIYYSPTPLPMNEPLSHSGSGQENAEALPDHTKKTNLNYLTGAAASPGILQHQLLDPTIVTGVSNPSAYSGEDRHRKFQTRPVRQQGRSTRRGSHCRATTAVNGGDLTPAYLDIGDADWRCQWCGASFWFGERLKSSRGSTIRYSRCCGEGNVRLQEERDPPDSIKLLFKGKHFMENIRAYNQMFIEQLIEILDTHNELVALFRTARDLCNENDVPDFTVRLYNVDGARQYDLPSADILGAIVFESGPETDTEYDVVIHKKGERPQRINKLHSTYMALQFPLLFVYGQPGYKALYEEKKPLCVTRYRLNDTEQEQQKNRIPFQELYKHKAASYKGVRFTCEATITKVNTSRGWYYTSCCVCISKVTYEDGNYKCKTHGVIPAPNYRYNFRATLTDGATSATFIFFTPKADDFLGINCGDLVASNKKSQQSHFPNEIQATVGTTHTFQFHYNTTSNPGVTEFVVDEVFGITDKPKAIASDMPKALPAPTAELKGETTTNTMDHNDSSKDITQLAKLQNVEPEGDKAMLKKEHKTPCKEEQGNLPQAETNQVLKKEEETACKQEQHSLPEAETKQGDAFYLLCC